MDIEGARRYADIFRKRRASDIERMTSLTDASGNATTWTFGASAQAIEETITVSTNDLTRAFAYDAAGYLVEKTDRNGRVIRYSYDNLLRQVSEAWYDDLQDQTANLTYTTTYDTASRVASVSDGTTSLSYTYSIFGNLTSQTQSLDGLADDVVFDYRYDAAGRKTSVATKIGTTDDYVNEYDYDALDRIVKVTQAGIPGGNAVAEKRVEFSYSDDGTSARIDRYADLAGTDLVATTDQAFDELGRVQEITHRQADEVFADYDYTWDAVSRITEIDMVFQNASYNDTATYGYDNTSQLTDADYITQANEDYDYDETGNRTLVDGTESYTTGDHNRLLSDGAYYYTYDAEGNRTGKYSDSQRTVAVQKYFWDYRNRLVKVEVYDAGTLDQIVEYAYDYANRRYSRTIDTNADQTIDGRSIFVYDEVNNQIVLELADDGTGSVTSSDAAKRLFYGTNIDEILAEEHAGDKTYWTLTDHLNTIRDLLSFSSGTTTLEQHNTFSTFGELLGTPTIETLLLYTARPFDYDTALQNNLNRWYDARIGRWMSTDPIGFEAGDVNLYRYVGNGVTLSADPLGLARMSRDGRIYWGSGAIHCWTSDWAFIRAQVTKATGMASGQTAMEAKATWIRMKKWKESDRNITYTTETQVVSGNVYGAIDNNHYAIQVVDMSSVLDKLRGIHNYHPIDRIEAKELISAAKAALVPK